MFFLGFCLNIDTFNLMNCPFFCGCPDNILTTINNIIFFLWGSIEFSILNILQNSPLSNSELEIFNNWIKDTKNIVLYATESPCVHMVLRASIGMNRFVREYHALLYVILKQTELADISFQQMFTRQKRQKSVKI